MELHRSRSQNGWAAAVILGGLVLVWASQNGWELQLLFIPLGSTVMLVVGVLMALIGVATIAISFRPGPLVIGQEGLHVRTAGIDKLVPWPAVAALILEPHVDGSTHTTRLVLVPVPGVDLGVEVEYANKVDGRAGVILFGLDDVREPVADVARALAMYAGPRFVSGVAGLPGPGI